MGRTIFEKPDAIPGYQPRGTAFAVLAGMRIHLVVPIGALSIGLLACSSATDGTPDGGSDAPTDTEHARDALGGDGALGDSGPSDAGEPMPPPLPPPPPPPPELGDSCDETLVSLEVKPHAAYVLNRTVLGVLGVESAYEDEALGFTYSGFPEGAPISDRSMEQLGVNARAAAALAADSAEELAGCEPRDDEVCLRKFVTEIVSRLYGRELSDSEVSSFLNLAGDGASIDEGAEQILEAALQSPYFLYPIYFGDEEGWLTNLEADARVASFLGGVPLAETPTLDTGEAVGAAAATRLGEPEIIGSLNTFHTHWLWLRGGSDLSEPLAEAMIEETLAFTTNVILRAKSIGELYKAPYSYLNDELRSHYGVPLGGGDFTQTSLDENERAGLLTQGSFLAFNSPGGRPNPTLRGAFIRHRILCQPVPPPPPDIDVDPAPVEGPNRARYEPLLAERMCSGCHNLTTRIGLGFEHYDERGRFREMDGSFVVDATGELRGTDVEREFDGAIELAAALAESDNVASCLVTQWFRYAMRTREQPEHACALRKVEAAVTEASGEIRRVLTAIPQTETFRRRAVPAAAEPTGDPIDATSPLEHVEWELEQAIARLTDPETASLEQHLDGLRDFLRRSRP